MTMIHNLTFLTIYWNYKHPFYHGPNIIFFQLYLLKTTSVPKVHDHFVFPITYLKKLLQ